MTQSKHAEEVQRIPVDEAKRRSDRGEAIILDVRSDEAFAEGHVKGASHIPIQELPRRHQELPVNKDIVTY